LVSVPESIEIDIRPDFYGDIIYDLEFLLTQPDDRAEKPSPAKQEIIPAPITEQASAVKNQQNEIHPETKINDSRKQTDDDSEGKHFSIQLGVFKIHQNAWEFAAKFRRSFDFPVSIILENNLYKVKTETFKTLSEAEMHKEMLESKGWECSLVSED
jgi:cell division protein FtsN